MPFTKKVVYKKLSQTKQLSQKGNQGYINGVTQFAS